jgi:Flp pilus assembly protein TadD
MQQPSSIASSRYSTNVNRDTIIYCTCTFLLGLVMGSLLIGPRLAKKEPVAATTAASAPAPAATDTNPMADVFRQIATLKEAIERDPKNADALIQLGNMYMDAAKYPEAIGYLNRALAVREDPNVLIDVGICLKETGQPEKALASFQRAAELAPGQWQPLYNQAVVLGEMRRTAEAKAIAAKLKAMRPDDPEIARLVTALR